MTTAGNNIDGLSRSARDILDRAPALFIGGKRVAAATGREIPVLAPSSACRVASLADAMSVCADVAIKGKALARRDGRCENVS